jgi:CubicO group peptidase (beta-lactamase class C family)
MARSRLAAFTLAMFLVLPGALGGWTRAEADTPPGDDLEPLLEPIRQKYQLPGLAAAVARVDRVVAAGAVGVRAVGKEARIELTDRFHIGSCTKTMTAMLIARLIDQGKLSWNTTLAEALPGVAMRPEYRTVTIRQLLTFRGGIAPYTTFQGGERPPAISNLKGDDPADIRLQFVRAVLNEPPVAPPGTEPVYSNASFAVAGAIIDRLAGRPWETAIVADLFRPLGMTDSVVGPPHSGSADQPVGHRKGGAMGPLTKVEKGRKDQPVDRPRGEEKNDDGFQPAGPPMMGRPFQHVIAPAGQVSCSILDFARYTRARLAGLRGNGPLLSADAYAAMARSDEADDGFTGGTGRVRTLGKDGREFSANGSGGVFLAGIRLLPEQDTAIVVAMNGVSPEALEAVVTALKERYRRPE